MKIRNVSAMNWWQLQTVSDIGDRKSAGCWQSLPAVRGRQRFNAHWRAIL